MKLTKQTFFNSFQKLLKIISQIVNLRFFEIQLIDDSEIKRSILLFFF